MASKAELRREIAALGEELGAELPDLEPMNHADLSALLQDLKVHKDSSDDAGESAEEAVFGDANPDFAVESSSPPVLRGPLPIDGAASGDLGGPPPPPPPEPPARKYEFQVAPGHAVVCERGNLGPGKELRLSDFSQDPDEAREALQRHLDAGRILHNRG